MLSLASPNGGGGGDVHDAFYNRQMRRKAAVVCCAAAGGAAALYLQREMSATCPFSTHYFYLKLPETPRRNARARHTPVFVPATRPYGTPAPGRFLQPL